MADVRRALAWEDLGFVQDRSTGEWAATRVLSSAPAGRALTWEDLGFVQDRAGRWTNRALRAGHHYNPSQPRDPGGEGGGQWTKGGGSFASKIAGAAKDAEALAAAPVRVVRDDDKRTITLAGVPEPQQRDLLMGVLTYTGGAHSDINAVLRGGDVHGSRPKAEEAIKKVDAAMRHSPLAHDVVVYRGIQDGRTVFRDAWTGDMTGVRFREPAYSSTTADRRVVDDFIDSRDPAPTELRIHVPAGTPAINLSNYGDGHIDEAELLLDRGLSFRVVADTTVHGRRHLDVEVVS